jgi:hypothetical protein
MLKIDFKKELKHLYRPSAKAFEVIDVPALQFLMIDGHGDPNTATEYTQAVEALYALSYKTKFLSKKELEKDYVVMPLEGLWWVPNMEEFSTYDKDAWDWTAMIMQPDWITAELIEEARSQVEKGKNPPALPKIRHEKYHEGLSVQIMHIGSYADEAPTLEKMHNSFIPDSGLTMTGKHHEIYLSDPRKTAPEKLKTVLRQPVEKV